MLSVSVALRTNQKINLLPWTQQMDGDINGSVCNERCQIPSCTWTQKLEVVGQSETSLIKLTEDERHESLCEPAVLLLN